MHPFGERPYLHELIFPYFALAGVNGATGSENSGKSEEIASDLSGPFKDVVENVIPSLIYGDESEAPDSKCERSFIKCSGGILINGSLQHMNEPDGISG